MTFSVSALALALNGKSNNPDLVFPNCDLSPATSAVSARSDSVGSIFSAGSLSSVSSSSSCASYGDGRDGKGGDMRDWNTKGKGKGKGAEGDFMDAAVTGDLKGDAEESLSVGGGMETTQKNKTRTKYLVAGLEIDESPLSTPRLSVNGRPPLCCLQTDLVLSGLAGGGDGDNDGDEDDGFIELVPEGGMAITAATGHTRYAPPERTSDGPYRRVFMLWEQPEAVTEERIRGELGFREVGAGLVTRTGWDQNTFESRLGLGRVLASGCFVS